MSIETDIKNWYNQRHLEGGKDAWRSCESYSVFLNYLNCMPDNKLLDIGCGTGYLLKEADKRGLKTYGVDISEKGVEIARGVSPNSEISIGRGEELKFTDNFFDYIVCIGALEHFLDINKGIQQMVRISRSGTLLCIVVPNINFLYWKFKNVKGTEQLDINESLMSLGQWRDIFIKNGFTITKVYQDKFIFEKINSIPVKNILGLLKKMFYKLIAFALPLKYTYQFVFVLKK